MKSTQSVQKNFLWNLLGSTSNALLSVVLLMLVTRTVSSLEADLYSLSFAVGNLLSMVGLFQVRNIQSTDVGQKYHFSVYLLVRVASNLLMIGLAVCYVTFSGFGGYKAFLIILMTLYRVSDSFSDVFQGLFQQRERLDIAGKSLFFRNLLILLVFSIAIILTHNLMISVVLLVSLSLAFVLLYDVPKSLLFEKWVSRFYFKNIDLSSCTQLIKECLPLFVIGFSLVYIYNQPKYTIDILMQEDALEIGTQTIFGIIFMPTFVMNLLMLFFRPMLTQMSLYLHNGKVKQFNQLQSKTFYLLLSFNIIIILLSMIIGISFLELLYNRELMEYWHSFILLMISGGIASVCIFLDNVITVFRYQRLLIFPYGITLLVILSISKYFTIRYEIFGASISFLIAMCVWLVSMSVTYFMTRKNYFNKYY